METLFNPTITDGSLDSVDLGGAATGVEGDYTITFNAVGTHGDTDSATATLTIEAAAEVLPVITLSDVTGGVDRITGSWTVDAWTDTITSASVFASTTGYVNTGYDGMGVIQGQGGAVTSGTFTVTGLEAATEYYICIGDYTSIYSEEGTVTTAAARSLETMTKSELVDIAKEQGIEVTSKMTKTQLLETLNN